MDVSNLTYEDAISQLRHIIEQLERGNLGLERSLELYEQGVLLTQFCETKLKVVEERMQVLSARGLETQPAPTAPAGDSPETETSK